ncbi:MAG: TIGR01777 family oxidoreductase [Pseudomonadota bacterium]
MTDNPTPAATSETTRPRVVLAGGSGFLGRRLAAILGGNDYDVVILTRGNPRPPVGPISFEHWQPDQGDASAALGELVSGSQAVINLCGESIGGPRWTEARKAQLIASRVVPTERLVAACAAAEAPPAVFIQASGVGFYGIGNKAVDEESGTGGDFLADLARQWEAPLTALPGNVRAVTARLGVVLGQGGGALSQMLLPFKLFVGGPIAKGTQWLSWIHLHDATAILAGFIDDAAASGVYNVVAPNPVRNSEFAEAAGKALGRPSWMFTPRFVLTAMLGEQATLVCDGQQAVSKRLDHSKFDYPDIGTALASLI